MKNNIDKCETKSSRKKDKNSVAKRNKICGNKTAAVCDDVNNDDDIIFFLKNS